jgi:AI-2 transport protein TqsA
MSSTWSAAGESTIRRLRNVRDDNAGDNGMKASESTPAQVVTALAAAVALLYFFRSILAPFFLAIVVVVVVYAIADAVVRLLPKAPHWIVMILTGVILSVSIIAGFDVALRGLAGLVPEAQQMLPRLQDLLQIATSAVGMAKAPNLQFLLGNADLSAFVQATLTRVTGALSSVSLVVVFLAFLLACRPTIDLKIGIVASSPGRTKTFSAVLNQIERGVRDCVLTQTASAAIVAAGAGAVMWTIGLQNSLFWTIVIFLISYIPIVGGLVSSIAPALFALVQFPTIWQAATIFGAIQAINIVVGNVVLPKMRATSQNIDPVVGMLAFSICSLLWGVPGAILANPITLVLMIVLAQFENTRWVAVMISNDGKPQTNLGVRGECGGADRVDT